MLCPYRALLKPNFYSLNNNNEKKHWGWGMSTSSTILGILPFSADAKSKYCIYDMGTKNISVYFDFKYIKI